MSVLNRKWTLLWIFGLLSLATSVYGQTCSIAGESQFINIYDVPTSGGPDVIQNFEISNAINIIEATNEGMQEDYIGATLSGDTLIIHKTDKFASYAENESERSILFKIQFNCNGGTTPTYTFTIYLQETNDNAPTFPQSEYNVLLPLPLPSKFEVTGTIFARDIDLGDNKVQFTGGNSYFTVETIGRSADNPKEYYMSLQTARQILILPPEATTIEVTATDNGGLTGTTTIQLNVDPDNSYSRDPSPTFEQLTYNFRIDEGGNYFNNFCYLKEESFEEGEVAFSLSGQDRAHFVVQSEGRQANVLFSSILSEQDFTGKTYLIVELLATRDGYETGHAAIFVDLPVECSSDTTTTAAPCENNICPDSDGPVFTQKLYTYRIFEGTLAGIGAVQASIDDSQLLATLRYRLNYNENPWLESIVTIDEITGVLLIIQNSLPNNANSFDIEVLATVEDQDTTKVGSARVIVVIDKNEVCSATSVEKSLAFLTVKEEQRNADIFDMKIDDCEYDILSIIPNDKEYVFISENQKLSTIEIDRESESFGQMTVPQVQVKLKLICPQDVDLLLLQRKRRAIEDNLDNVFTDEIPFNSDITQLNIFIEDINDNAPVFEEPSEAVTNIGYPDADLVALLMPPYLIKVEASDADEGVNAQIEYQLVDDYFGIDSKSGIIYPKNQEMDNEVLPLIVSATDSVHVTSVVLRVHKLSVDHLIVIYVENWGAHELEEIVKLIETELELKLQILKYANVPGSYTRRSSFSDGRSTTGTHLKLIAYAFDQDSKLVNAEELLEIFSKVDGSAPFILSTMKLQEEITAISETAEGKGTIVAVIILSVLVFILLCAGFVGWWFWIRPTEWKHIEETPSMDNVRIDPPQSAVDITGKSSTEEMKEKERPSLNLNGHTWTESSDSPQIIKNVTTTDDVETVTPITAAAASRITTPATTPNATPRERKKSITFNENVERIEIENVEVPVPVTVNTYQF